MQSLSWSLNIIALMTILDISFECIHPSSQNLVIISTTREWNAFAGLWSYIFWKVLKASTMYQRFSTLSWSGKAFVPHIFVEKLSASSKWNDFPIQNCNLSKASTNQFVKRYVHSLKKLHDRSSSILYFTADCIKMLKDDLLSFKPFQSI